VAYSLCSIIPSLNVAAPVLMVITGELPYRTASVPCLNRGTCHNSRLLLGHAAALPCLFLSRSAQWNLCPKHHKCMHAQTPSIFVFYSPSSRPPAYMLATPTSIHPLTSTPIDPLPLQPIYKPSYHPKPLL
jgi:hypothetical protein